MSKTNAPAAPAKTAMQTQQSPAEESFSNLRQLLDKSKGQLAKVLPNVMDAERAMRIALTVCQRQPQLLECHPLSVVACVMLAGELGLELSGPLGQCFMIPRKNKHTKRLEATFQVGYRGFQKLAYNSGKVISLPMRAVYSNDDFDISYGTDSRIHHKPCVKGDRGVPIGYYCIANLSPMGQDFEYMSHPDMVKHRAKYAEENPIWDTDFEPMALKTVVRKLCKRLPVSAQLVKAAGYDEFEETANVRRLTPVNSSDQMAQATMSRLSTLKEKLADDNLSDFLPADAAARLEEPTPQQEPPAKQVEPTPSTAATAATPTTQAPTTPPPQQPANLFITDSTRNEIAKLRTKLGWSDKQFHSYLSEWAVQSIDDLTEANGLEVVEAMSHLGK